MGNPISEEDAFHPQKSQKGSSFSMVQSLNSNDELLGYVTITYEEGANIQIYPTYYLLTSILISLIERFRIIAKNERLQKKLEEVSLRDMQTGLLNEKGFLRFVEKRKLYIRKGVLILFYLENYDTLRKQHGKEQAQHIALYFVQAFNTSRTFTIEQARFREDCFLAFCDFTESEVISFIGDVSKRMSEISRQRKLSYTVKITAFTTNSQPADSIEQIETGINDLKEQLEAYIETPTQKASFYYNTLDDMRKDIFSDPQIDRNVEKLAEGIGLSVSRLQHLYKEQFCTTISADITTARMELAKKLLLETDASISEISSECGYKSFSHFSRTFRKHFGLSPAEYRKNNGKYE